MMRVRADGFATLQNDSRFLGSAEVAGLGMTMFLRHGFSWIVSPSVMIKKLKRSQN